MSPIAHVPQELLDLYAALVREAPSPQVAGQHLLNFVEDAKSVVTAIQDVLDAANARQAAA